MELDDLHVLIHLSDHGSIRGAAQKLGVSRSALRRQLERLERAFETPLVIREGRGIQLSPAGELAAARARPLLAEAGAMVEQARAEAGKASGVVRILLPIGMPAAARVRGLPALLANHPQLRLSLREVPDPLRWAHLPFELMAHFGPPPEGMDLVTSVLGRFERRLLATPSYLEAHGTPTSIADLEHHRVLMWRCPGLPEDQLPRVEGGWAPVEPWLTSSDASVVLEAANAGLGLAFMPGIFTGEAELVQALAETVGDVLTMRLSSLRPSRLDPRVAALLDNIHRITAQMAERAEPG